MRTVKVKYFFEATTEVQVADNASLHDIDIAATLKGEEMVFCLEGETSYVYDILSEGDCENEN